MTDLLAISIGILCIATALAAVTTWWRVAWMPRRGVLRSDRWVATIRENLCEKLRRDLQVLAGEIGERNVSRRYDQLARAAEFIESSLAAASYEVHREEFSAEGKAVRNVYAQRPGCTRPDEIIIIAAHYDSVPGSAGANDNGSGVVANLALARAFADVSADRTIRFAFFANEEMPYYMTAAMGALHHAEACRELRENVIGMIALETIGYYVDGPNTQRYPLRVLSWFYPSTGNFLAFVGNMPSRRLIHAAIGGFRQSGFPSAGIAAPNWLRDIFRSDHAAFWHCGYPALMITDTANFRYPYYHTPQDTPDKINFEALAQIVIGLASSVRELVIVNAH
jgi:hypothetical protein